MMSRTLPPLLALLCSLPAAASAQEPDAPAEAAPVEVAPITPQTEPMVAPAMADAEQQDVQGWFRMKVVSELGFADVLKHTVQFSKNGSEFDYVKEGGQDILFQYFRLSVEGTIKRRHTIIFLYAPLDLQTNVRLERDVSIDEETFAAGSALDTRYNFPVFRISYLYDLLDDRDDELAFGASLQLRNAIIDFTSADGTKRRTNRNVGPVPVLKLRARKTFDSGLWIGAEIDGFYANIRYINGGDEDILGAVLDANARVGVALTEDLDAFFNVRYFGGGGEGTNTDDTGPGDGFTKNWLHVSTITVGFILYGFD
jgi:hypothetical protein